MTANARLIAHENRQRLQAAARAQKKAPEKEATPEHRVQGLTTKP